MANRGAMLKAEIIVVGSELLSPLKQDTNSIWLTERLEDMGIEVTRKSVVGDDLETLTQTFDSAMGKADLVLSTGGLGPTADDLTRDALAAALGVELELRPEIVEDIRAKFARRGREMAENNSRQALLPVGAESLENPSGTAPGIKVKNGRALIFVLPGPPRELKPMFTRFAEPELKEHTGEFVSHRRKLHVTAMGESDMDAKIAPLYSGKTNPVTTINFTSTDLEIHLTARARTMAEAEALNGDLASQVAGVLGVNCYCDVGRPLEEVCGALLRERGLKIATAESLTGGLVAERLTRVAGASDYVLGGLVVYTNEMKCALLGLDPAWVEAQGAVSQAVAQAMATAVRERTGADLGLSATGFAGPGGGTEEDPVGTVYVGIAGPDRVRTRRLSLPGDRELVRLRASQMLLFLLFKYYLSPT